MCLAAIKETYDHPSTLVVDGWKEFGGSSSKPSFQAFHWNKSANVPLDKWITATTENAKEIRAGDGNKYEPGFHAFCDESELKRKPGFRRVFLRKITCLGTDCGMKAVIAQEMYVPSDKNGWPPKDGEPDKSIMNRIKDVLPGNA